MPHLTVYLKPVGNPTRCGFGNRSLVLPCKRNNLSFVFIVVLRPVLCWVSWVDGGCSCLEGAGSWLRCSPQLASPCKVFLLIQGSSGMLCCHLYLGEQQQHSDHKEIISCQASKCQPYWGRKEHEGEISGAAEKPLNLPYPFFIIIIFVLA